MKEYNLKDSTIGSNLPVQYGALGKIKNFVRGKVMPALTLELTEKEEKVLTEVHTFMSQELEFPELKKFLYQEIDLSGIKNFWSQDVNFKEVKEFWSQDVDFSGVKKFFGFNKEK